MWSKKHLLKVLKVENQINMFMLINLLVEKHKRKEKQCHNVSMC